MREPGSDGNLNVTFFQNISDNVLTLFPKNNAITTQNRYIGHCVNFFAIILHIPDFAWISHTFPLKLPCSIDAYCSSLVPLCTLRHV